MYQIGGFKILVKKESPGELSNANFLTKCEGPDFEDLYGAWEPAFKKHWWKSG